MDEIHSDANAPVAEPEQNGRERVHSVWRAGEGCDRRLPLPIHSDREERIP